MAKHFRNKDDGKVRTEETLVDPAALDHIFDIVERLRRSKGFVGPQYDWYGKVGPLRNSRRSNDPSQVKVDDRALQRAVQSKKMLKSATDALHKIWGHVSRQLEICEADIDAYKLRRRFFSPPDEILSMVLEFAALQDDGKDEKETILSTVKAATKLSHVCRRFRDLIIHSPMLWRRVFNEMGRSDMAYTCISRWRRANAEVILATSPFEASSYRDRRTEELDRLRNVSFIQNCLEKSEHWGSFTMEGISEGVTSMPGYESGCPQDYTKLATNLDFPNLTQLAVRYPEAALSSTVRRNKYNNFAMHFYSVWSTPKLRSMTSRNIIPIPFSGSQSLTSLSIFLNYKAHGDLDVKSFVSFLSACPALERFVLEVHHASYGTTSPVPERCVEMPCITDLNFAFVKCYRAPLKALFDAVRFPHITSMRLRIESVEEEGSADMHFNDIFFTVLPNAETFPKLRDLVLDVDAEGWRDANDVYVDGSISIPFAAMPSKVRNLTLITHLTEVHPIPDDVALPAIRTLVLRDSFRLGKEWLVQFLRRVKARGDLDLDLLRVSVDDQCAALNVCEIKGSISNKKIQILVEG